MEDAHLKLLRDLVKKYKPKAKVRRKYLISQTVKEKVPYVFVDLDAEGESSYAIACRGTDFRLYKVDKIMDDWKKVSTTDTFDKLYDIMDNVLSGKSLATTDDNFDVPVLNDEQYEWLQAFMQSKKPQVIVKKFHNGSVGAYDSTNVINGHENPLFVIYRSSNKEDISLQIHTEDGGGGMMESKFSNVKQLFDYLGDNLEVATQLIKMEKTPETKLPELLAKQGFKFISNTEVALSYGNTKTATIYDNEHASRIFLFHDGSSKVWKKDVAGENKKYNFKTIAELVGFLENPSKFNPDTEAWTTGDKELDSMIEQSGFQFDLEKSNILFFFKKKDGTMLQYGLGDHSSTLYFNGGKNSVSFLDNDELQDHLENTKETPNDMPWSGTNYQFLWASQPSDKMLQLTQVEDETMKKWDGLK
jgi:hypothetical protein